MCADNDKIRGEYDGAIKALKEMAKHVVSKEGNNKKNMEKDENSITEERGKNSSKNWKRSTP